MNGVDCSSDFAELMAMSMHLKSTHFGKSGNVHVSKAMAITSTLMYYRQYRGLFPEMPSDDKTMALLQQGLDIEKVRRDAYNKALRAAGYGNNNRTRYRRRGRGMMQRMMHRRRRADSDEEEEEPATPEPPPEITESELTAHYGDAAAFMQWRLDVEASLEKVRRMKTAKGMVLWDLIRKLRRTRWKETNTFIADIACKAISSPIDPVVTSRPNIDITDMNGDQRKIAPFAVGAAGDDSDAVSLKEVDVKAFMSSPLSVLNLREKYFCEDTSNRKVDALDGLPFHFTQHPSSRALVAKQMLRRTDADVHAYKKQVVQRNTNVVHLRYLSPSDIARLGSDDGPALFADARALLEDLGKQLRQLRAQDTQMLERSVALIERLSSEVTLNGDDTDAERLRFLLGRQARQLPKIDCLYILQASLSSTPVEDLLKRNPFVNQEEKHRDIVNLVTGLQLTVGRIATASHSLAAMHSVFRALDSLDKALVAGTAAKMCLAMQTDLKHKVKKLETFLLSKRHICQPDEAAAADACAYTIDPRYLTFEYMFDIMLRRRQVEMVNDFVSTCEKGGSSCQQMIMGAGKTTVVGPLLSLCLSNGRQLVTQTMPSALLEMTRNKLREVFTSMLPKRIFTLTFDRSMGHEDASTDYDPDTVVSVLNRLKDAQDNRGIVVATPESIKSLFLKFIEQLHVIERVGENTFEQLQRSTGGRVHGLFHEAQDQFEQCQARALVADTMHDIFEIWKGGVLIMDEVDVLLHPLKSELNFPIGEKYAIDMGADRWDLPIHMLSIAFLLRGEPTDFSNSTNAGKAEQRAGFTAEDVVTELHALLEKGKAGQHFQMVPHLVLLSPQFYKDLLMPAIARWALLWVHQHSDEDLTAHMSNAEVLRFFMGHSDEYDIAFNEGCGDDSMTLVLNELREHCKAANTSFTEPEVKKHATGFTLTKIDDTGAEFLHTHLNRLQIRRISKCPARLSTMPSRTTMKLLNMAVEWVSSLMPHVLAKIDRVTYGLLKAEDKMGPCCPLSRRLMAVPFIGKDVPSVSSEFAHPDVLIGLTVLAYRYESMRNSDMKRLMKQLKSDFTQQAGNKKGRESALMFEIWKRTAAHRKNQEGGHGVLSLDLFQPSDDTQIEQVGVVIRFSLGC